MYSNAVHSNAVLVCSFQNLNTLISDLLCLSPVHHRKLCDRGQGQGSAGEGFLLGLSYDFHFDHIVLCEYIMVFISVVT